MMRAPPKVLNPLVLLVFLASSFSSAEPAAEDTNKKQVVDSEALMSYQEQMNFRGGLDPRLRKSLQSESRSVQTKVWSLNRTDMQRADHVWNSAVENIPALRTAMTALFTGQCGLKDTLWEVTQNLLPEPRFTGISLTDPALEPDYPNIDGTTYREQPYLTFSRRPYLSQKIHDQLNARGAELYRRQLKPRDSPSDNQKKEESPIRCEMRLHVGPKYLEYVESLLSAANYIAGKASPDLKSGTPDKRIPPNLELSHHFSEEELTQFDQILNR